MISLTMISGGCWAINEVGEVKPRITIRRRRSGASVWLVDGRDGQPMFVNGSGRQRLFTSLTLALDAVLAHQGWEADARAIVDEAMIRSGRAAPPRGEARPVTWQLLESVPRKQTRVLYWSTYDQEVVIAERTKHGWRYARGGLHPIPEHPADRWQPVPDAPRGQS